MIEAATIQELHLCEFETSHKEGKFLVIYKDRYFEVSYAVARLIQVLKKSDSLEHAAKVFSEERDKNYTPEELDVIIGRCLDPIVNSIDKKPKKPLLFNVELISAQRVSEFSRVLKVLFQPAVAGILLAGVIVLETLFFVHANLELQFGQLDLYTILGIVGLFMASSGFHELGHASACQYYGIRHGGVGFGMYLTFPVFYTDVSNIWQLSRSKRLLVNVAGTYFQLIFLMPLILIYLYTHNTILTYFILTVNINFLITLNPFFKFDGYWIVSDLLGVPNLRQRTNELLSYVYKKIRNKPVDFRPFLMTMKPGSKIFMAIYSLTVNVFFIYFFCYAIPRFFYGFFSTVPELVKQLAADLAMGNAPSFELIKAVFTPIFFFGCFVYMLICILKPYIAGIVARGRAESVFTGEK